MFRKALLAIFCVINCIFPMVEALNPVIVSVGCNCEVAVKLKEFGLRKEAYPFDWVFSRSLDDVTKCIAGKFAHWLDPEYLHYKRWHIYNSYYDIGFSHDFPVVPNSRVRLFRENYEDYLPEISKKYARRIKRFYDLLQSDKFVIFMYTRYGTELSSYNFINYIKEAYPNLKFLLVNVNQGNKKDLQAIIDGDLIRFFCFEKEGFWWKSSEWSLIFRQLGINLDRNK